MNGIDLTGEAPVVGAREHTDEQKAILAQPPTSTIIVDAAAGTGKTSTLADYARRWNKHRGLYLAFNKPAADDAQSRFPPWVRAQTVHSFAYHALGVSKHKDRMIGRLRRQTIYQAGIDVHSEYLSPDRMIRCILDGINNFCSEGGAELLPVHCGLDKSPLRVQEAVMPRIAAAIKRFINYETSGLPFTHDIYLKNFELFGKIGDAYDYVMVDEAQDSNGVTLSIAQKSGLPVLLIGDDRQSIYAFRGAINAMSKVEAPRFPLSMSWRFGPEVAALANHILSHSETPPTLIVRGRPDRKTEIERYNGKAPSRSFLLARTNGRLLEGLTSIPPNTTFHVAGGFDVLAGQMLSALALSKNDQKNVKDSYVRSFMHWEELKDEADHDDPDARKLVKIVSDYGDQIPEIIERLRAQHRVHHQDAQILLSTAHKAKGLESDCVIILDDFSTPRELRARVIEDKMTEQDYEQELNLLYVACTRARYRLLLCANLYDDFAHVIGGKG